MGVNDRRLWLYFSMWYVFNTVLSIQRANYKQQLLTMQRYFEVKLREALHEAETNKNNHIYQLVKKHQLNFNKMKKYYLDITTSNLDLIKSLKDEVEEMRKK